MLLTATHQLPSTAAGYTLPVIKHVWVVMLENEGYAAAFQTNPNPYLPALPKQGAIIPKYYGIGHQSLDNYIALLGGQAPTAETQADCPDYTDVSGGTDGQAPGQQTGHGCVYAKDRVTVADQLEGAGYRWKGYMEDLMNDPARDGPVTCAPPAAGGTPDQTQTAESTDQYAVRHDPFMYYHSIIDRPACRSNVVPLQSSSSGLSHDLASIAATPNFSFVVPNLCNDGHDGGSSSTSSPCKGQDISGSTAGGLVSLDHWLSTYVPQIMSSAAYQQDGMLVVAFDEAADTDGSGCCNEGANPGTSPGVTGQGGGQVGAVVLSPFVKPGTVVPTSYNHYSLLRTVEDAFRLTGGDDGHGHLGRACDDACPNATSISWNPGQFGADVFTNPGYVPPPPTPGNEVIPVIVPQPNGPPPSGGPPVSVGANQPNGPGSPRSPGPTAAAAASPASSSPDVAQFDLSMVSNALPDPGGAPLLALLVLAPLLSVGIAAVLLRRRSGS